MNAAVEGPLGQGPRQLTAFATYIDRFNAADIDGFTAYYADDVLFNLGVAPPFHAKKDVKAFYRSVFAVIRETVTVKTLAVRPDGLSVGISVRFTAFEDAPDFVLGPLKRGGSAMADFAVEYGLSAGLVSSVQVAMIGQPKPS